VQKKMSDDEGLETTQNHYLDTAVIARGVLEVLAAGMSIKEAAARWNPRRQLPKLSDLQKGKR
jgi:hypothetical protein